MKQAYIIYLMGVYVGELDYPRCVADSEELARKWIEEQKRKYPTLDYRYEPIDFYTEMPK